MPVRGISRRAFVLTSLAAGSAVLVLAGLASFPTSGMASWAARTIVRTRLSYLRLDPAGLARFAEDIVARYPSDRLSRLTVLGWMCPVYSRFFSPTNLEADLVSSFLLGSDLFRRDRTRDVAVAYVGFYDPYTMICGNPFARFD